MTRQRTLEPVGRPDTFDLTDRVVVLTGASSGLGAQFARSLADAGCRLVLAARRLDRLESVRAEIGSGEAVECDVRLPADRARLVETALARWGRVDVLINNAGIARSGPAVEESDAGIEDTLQTNLIAAFGLCRLVEPAMTTHGGGSIVNISSLAYARSVDRFGLASYAASKAGLVALTRELAAQWGCLGIRVNAIAPAWFPSEMSGWLSDPDLVDWIGSHNALGRPGRRDELDGTLRFLASDASSYVTGQTIAVDGGWSAF